MQEYEKHCQKLQFKSLSYTPTKSSNTESLHRSDGCASRVYTDIPYVEEFLTRTEFVISKYSDSLILRVSISCSTSLMFQLLDL